jgi:hypothetical protein
MWHTLGQKKKSRTREKKYSSTNIQQVTSIYNSNYRERKGHSIHNMLSTFKKMTHLLVGLV